jgi:hypothetical protein
LTFGGKIQNGFDQVLPDQAKKEKVLKEYYSSKHLNNRRFFILLFGKDKPTERLVFLDPEVARFLRSKVLNARRVVG